MALTLLPYARTTQNATRCILFGWNDGPYAKKQGRTRTNRTRYRFKYFFQLRLGREACCGRNSPRTNSARELRASACFCPRKFKMAFFINVTEKKILPRRRASLGRSLIGRDTFEPAKKLGVGRLCIATRIAGFIDYLHLIRQVSDAFRVMTRSPSNRVRFLYRAVNKANCLSTRKTRYDAYGVRSASNEPPRDGQAGLNLPWMGEWAGPQKVILQIWLGLAGLRRLAIIGNSTSHCRRAHVDHAAWKLGCRCL